MARKKITVVLSQTQSKNPTMRALEEDIAAALLMEPDIDLSIIPHLYDLTRDHTGMLFLQSVPGNLVVLAWLFPRAIHWTLDRNNVKGHFGQSLLHQSEDEDSEGAEPQEAKGIGSTQVPDRRIYCLDLRNEKSATVYIDEVKRIARENSIQTVDLMDWISGKPNGEQLKRYLNPALPAPMNGNGDAAKRRWYPVIDYSRCTNCMECIDFCLFGVYGIDNEDRILVEAQDNCKKGCPACSRVCPEHAIIFPEHKTPEIAGADVGEVGELKIDLSRLFGGGNALDLAVAERDRELVADGREAVGIAVGIPKRQQNKPERSRDDLDDLVDGLDDLDL